tara:strand:- start:9818 stop:13177 length:3360 start_codon:yes stop_codon:yes gene_type:complete
MAARKFKFVSPGVFLKEIDNSQLPKLPGGVGPVIIGRTKRGPSLKPVKVSSFQDFVRVFGETVPGNQGSDPWRDGNGLLASAYAPYAAQAYLNANIQSPVTVIRLAGVAGDDAVGDDLGAKHPGWFASKAFGLFAFQGKAATAATATITVTDAGGVGHGETFKLIDANGLETTYTINGGVAATAAGAGGSGGNATVGYQGVGGGDAGKVAAANAIKEAINRTSDAAYTAVTDGVDKVTVTQAAGTGASGNRTNSDSVGGVTVGNFTGGEGPFASSHPTGSLIATIYASDKELDQGSDVQVGFKGQAVDSTAAASGSAKNDTGDGGLTYDASLKSVTNALNVVQPNNDNTFSLLINVSGATWQGIERRVSFTPGSSTYIRDVLNTNPVKTNPQISRSLSGTLAHKYWLGETFEEEYQRLVAMAGDSSKIFVASIPLSADMYDFKSQQHQMSPGQTGWVFGQHTGPTGSFDGRDQQRLFRAISLHEGESPSRDLIVGIENIRVPEDGDADPYGKFTVTVKKLSGVRLEELERFDGCNMNPNSQNFIARKIGNQYFEWSSVEKRNKVYGSYPNVSDYIRVEMDPDVLENGPDNAAAVPFGFFGPVVPADVDGDIDSGELFPGSGNAKNDFVELSATKKLLINGVTTNAKLQFPKQPLIVTGSLQDPVFGVSPFKLSYTSTGHSEETAIPNPGYVDFCRRAPQWGTVLTDHLDGIVAKNSAKSKYSFIFSLDDVVVTGSTELAPGDLSAYVATEIKHIPGSRALGTSATAKADIGELTKELFDSFQMPLVGGFEGVDITEADPFNMRVVDSTATTANNYAYASIDRALELIKDPESLEMNLAVMPGISNESLTTKLIQTCESRADALAIIDLPDVYKPPFQKSCDNFQERLGTTPAKAAKALKARQLNSSYGATYYPWVKVRDSIYTRDVWVPPSVVALGVMAYTEERNEVWFAPAGFNRGGLNEGNAGLAVLQVTEQLLSKHRDTLYEANINPIASFVTEGLVVFGQKTLQSTQSALDRINVRRLLIFVKKEVSRIANGLLFDQNLPATWNRFRSQVVPMLEGVKTRLGLSDFRVILDETTTTPDLVDRNIMYAKIFLKPARAIEFIAVDFVITNTGASFDD